MTDELVSRLGASTAEERTAGYILVDELVAGGTTPGAVATAVACAEALMATLGRPVADVPPAEFRRAVRVLESLGGLDHVAVASACLAGGGKLGVAAIFHPGNAFCAVLDIPVDELSREDILTLGDASRCFYTSFVLRGLPPAVSQLDDLMPAVMAHPLPSYNPRWESDSEGAARIERLSELTLALVRDPDAAPDDVAGGLCVACGLTLTRPAIVASLLKGGLLDSAVALAKCSSPMDWASASSAAGRQVMSIAVTVGSFAQVDLASVGYHDFLRLLVESGMVDVMVSLFKAHELRGASMLDDASVGALAYFEYCLSNLDITSAEGRPIMEMITGMPSTLRFLIDHTLTLYKDLGSTTSSWAGMLCALAFGKLEAASSGVGGSAVFDFSQQIIDDIVSIHSEWLHGGLAALLPVLPPYFLRPMVHLSVSDQNKTKLVQSAGLLTLLRISLFDNTDDSHPRKDMPAPNCAGIQLDGCECVAQLALFDRGRELLQQDSSIEEALEVVRERGLSPEAKESAHGALVALRGMKDLAASHEDIVAEHIMLSYRE
jgi:hypothetical protein